MAFIPKPKKTDSDNSVQAPQQAPVLRSSAPGARLSRPSSQFGAPAPSSSMSGNPNSPMAGGGDFGRFVSLGEYLGQNQQQAGEMAGKVGGSVQSSGNNAQAGVNKLETSFNSAVGQTDKSKYGASGNTNKFTGTNLETFNPAGYAAAQAAATDASDRANNLMTAGGVQNQLGNTYNQTSQSLGEGMWDAAQAQQAGGGRFAQLAARYGNLGQTLTDANARAQAAYDAMQAKNAAWDEEQRKKKAAADAAAQADAQSAADAQEAQQAPAEQRETVGTVRGSAKNNQSGMDPDDKKKNRKD